MNPVFQEQPDTNTKVPKTGQPFQPWVAEVLSFIGSASRRFSIPALLPPLQKLSEFNQEFGSLDIVLLGRFKAGKSSLLNSLLNLEILPTDVLPATAVVTRVMAGISDRMTVYFRDGRIENTSPRFIAQFATEKDNPENQKEVVRVDVELEGIGSWEGVRWVDSPGIGSLHAHNTEATLDWLPKVGVALMAVSADHPLSEDDLSLIQQLEEHTPKTLLLVTKADLVAKEQMDSILGYVRSQLKNRLGREIPVIPVSIKSGYEATREYLRRFLIDQLISNRFSESEGILRYKLQALLKTCRSFLELALQVALAGQKARQELSGLINEEWQSLSMLENEMYNLQDIASHRIRQALEERLLPYREGIARELQLELEVEMSGWRSHLGKETAKYQAWLEARLTEKLEQLGRENIQVGDTHVREIESSVNRSARAFAARISDKVREALHFEYTGPVFGGEVVLPEKPSMHLGNVFDTPFEGVWFLVPMWIFRPLIHRHFLHTIPWQVEKHLYRLCSEWTEAMMEAVQSMAKDFQHHVRDEMETFQGLLEASRDSGEDLRMALEQLGKFERSVQKRTDSGQVDQGNV